MDFAAALGPVRDFLSARGFQDLADLRYLLQLPGIDREVVRQSFARHGQLATYERLVDGL